MQQTTYGFHPISVDHPTHLRFTNVLNWIDIWNRSSDSDSILRPHSTESTHDQAGSRLHVSYRKSTLPKSAKTSQVGMHFHQKPLPQKPTKQATMHIAVHAHTTHTSQHNALFYHVHVPTIPTSFQPHPPQSCITPHTKLHTQYFLQYTTIHNHHHKARHLVSSQQSTLLSLFTIITYSTKHNTPHYYQPIPSQVQEHYFHQNALGSTNPQTQTKHTYSSQHHTATNLCSEQTQTTSTAIQKHTQQS